VRARLLLVVLAISALSLAGCGGSSAGSDDPGEFAKQQYEQMSKGERGKVYDSLLPEQRSQEVLDAYWGCTEDTVGSLDFDRIEVVDVHDEPITVRGVSHPGKAVTLKIRLGPNQASVTRYVIKEDGHWYAAVSDHKLEQWHQGVCENP
jgi:hypothetical protein